MKLLCSPPNVALLESEIRLCLAEVTEVTQAQFPGGDLAGPASHDEDYVDLVDSLVQQATALRAAMNVEPNIAPFADDCHLTDYDLLLAAVAVESSLAARGGRASDALLRVGIRPVSVDTVLVRLRAMVRRLRDAVISER